MASLPTPPEDQEGATAWVAEHLGHLTLEGPDGVRASPRFRGGQGAADDALGQFDPRGYAAQRNNVLPEERRGASALSPYVRYGLLPLPRLHAHVADAPVKDKAKYRDELLWQEYARHLYSRVGARNGSALRYEPATAERWEDPWPREMRCMQATQDELEGDGWLVNQTRMWMASQWTVRAGGEWREGEDRFFTHLLDGSRAANRLGWQWTIGAGTGKPYGFSRWQVQKRAPELCGTCALRDACPIEDWPPERRGGRVEPPEERLRADPDLRGTAGPPRPERTGDPGRVWLTAESLGDDDPALLAHPDLPATFVFDERLLGHWRLSGKRLVFLAETLGELATRRNLTVRLGDPVTELAGEPLAATFTPVPGWKERAARLDVVALHPWPWLARPHDGPIGSYSAWRKRIESV